MEAHLLRRHPEENNFFAESHQHPFSPPVQSTAPVDAAARAMMENMQVTVNQLTEKLLAAEKKQQNLADVKVNQELDRREKAFEERCAAERKKNEAEIRELRVSL